MLLNELQRFRNTKLESMKSQVKSLEEQAQFDRDEKEILFAEEVFHLFS